MSVGIIVVIGYPRVRVVPGAPAVDVILVQGLSIFTIALTGMLFTLSFQKGIRVQIFFI